MARLLIGSFLFVCSLSVTAAAQDESAKRILDKARSLRPGEKELHLFQLDWASSFKEASRRAAKEKRPVFLVVNYAQYGDLKRGHC